MTPEEVKKKIIDHYTRKFDDAAVKSECINFYNGKNKYCRKILQNNVSEILYKTRINNRDGCYNYTFEDILNNKDTILDTVILKLKLAEKENPVGLFQLYSNYNHYIDINNKHMTIRYKKPAYFDTNTAYEILRKYGKSGGNYYDSSAGWGNRLLASMKSHMNYYGIDPNYLLVDRLYKVYDDFKKYTNCSETCIIKPSGSETYIPEYKGKMDIAFTCPPYYDLEDYAIGNQSITGKSSYEEWLYDFMFTTLNNTIEYVKPGGYICLAVKNYNVFTEKTVIPLFDDCYSYLEDKLTHITDEFSKIIKLNTNKDNNEKIMVFRKE